MDIIVTIFNQFLYQPLFNLLVLFYNIIPGHDFGVSIILITLLIRIVLFPISIKGFKSRDALQKLQPEIKEIQRKYKDKKEEQAAKMMELYKKHKINPASGCLPILIQFPILIALYRALINILNNHNGLSGVLYPFVKNPGVLNVSFLGIIDLAVPSLFLAVLTGFFQFIQGKKMLKTTPTKQVAGQKMDIQKAMGKQMTYFMPLMIIFISLKLPAGLPLYWAVSTLFGIGEHMLINRTSKVKAAVVK